MQQFAHARPRLPPAAMAAAGVVAGQPTGVLQRRFHVGVRPLHAVVALRDLIEMAPVEAGVTLAIEPPDPLDLRAGRLARRGPSAAAIEQAVVAGGLIPGAPAAYGAIGAPDDLGRLPPIDGSTHRAQHHLANRHGPLQGRRRIEHGRPPGQPCQPTPISAERRDHLLRTPDRSCAPYSSPPRLLTRGERLPKVAQS
jgi:hypothetical protein